MASRVVALVLAIDFLCSCAHAQSTWAQQYRNSHTEGSSCTLPGWDSNERGRFHWQTEGAFGEWQCLLQNPGSSTGAVPPPGTNAIQQNNNLNQEIQALGDAINNLHKASQLSDPTDGSSSGVDNSENPWMPTEPQPAVPQPPETVYTITSNPPPPPASNEVVTGVNDLLSDDSPPPDSAVISGVNDLLAPPSGGDFAPSVVQGVDSLLGDGGLNQPGTSLNNPPGVTVLDFNNPDSLPSAVTEAGLAISDSLATDGPGVIKFAMADSEDAEVKALNEELEAGESFISTGETVAKVTTYAWKAFNGQTTSEENQEAATGSLNFFGDQALEANPIAQAIVSKNLNTAKTQATTTMTLFNNVMAAATSNEPYDENTDIQNIEYVSTSSFLPGSVLRFANAVSSAQKLVQATASDVYNIFACPGYYSCDN